jgi:thimet oligopeptidase
MALKMHWIVLVVGLAVIAIITLAMSFPGPGGMHPPPPPSPGSQPPSSPDAPPPGPPGSPEPVRTMYAPGDIPRLTDQAIRDANASLNAIAAVPPGERTFDNTVLRFDAVMTSFSEATDILGFMGDVHPDPVISAEGADSKEKTGIFLVGTMARRDLHDAMSGQTPRNTDEKRLYDLTMRDFRKNGLELPDDRLAKVRALRENLTLLEVRFSTNLNNDDTTLAFSREDLAGLPEERIGSFRKADNGSYLVTTQYPDYLTVMQYATKPDTRKRMLSAYVNRQADENTRLLEEAIEIRRQIADELGYSTWADYQTDGRMAENGRVVLSFLDRLKAPLQEKTRQELAGLLEVKKGTGPGATAVDAWDLIYLTELQKKRDYAYDEEEVRAYLPLDGVVEGMFREFGPMLGVRFGEVRDARAWSPDVKLFRVVNTSDGRTEAYLYLDLYPREGKYGHMAMFNLVPGRMENGTYHAPVSAIVANFRKPSGNTPSLLSPDDVEGLFHEFGHAMHESLTKAPYGSVSGTRVELDFVETPSQTFEEWAWNASVLGSVSGRYTNPAEKLPADLRDRIIRSRTIDVGRRYARQLALGYEDMVYHTSDGPVDTTAVSDRLYREMVGIPPVPGGHEPATIGHFMDGYDAGYYGYLWSKVYALNILDRFERDGLGNATTGAEYRRYILEPGNSRDGNTLMKAFLGKDPGIESLYSFLTITPGQGVQPGS